MRISAEIELVLTLHETRTVFSYMYVPRYESRYMQDSLSYRGASLWNFVNYNDKEASATLNFNQLRKQVSSEDYFIDFKFECTSASAIRCRQHNFIYHMTRRARAQFPWKTIREKVPYESRTRRRDKAGKTRSALLERPTAESMRVNDKNNFVPAKFWFSPK